MYIYIQFVLVYLLNINLVRITCICGGVITNNMTIFTNANYKPKRFLQNPWNPIKIYIDYTDLDSQNLDKSIINKTMKLSTLIKSINEVKENRTIGYLHNPKKISFSTQRINNSKNHSVVKSKTPLPQASQFSKDYSKMSDFIAQEKDLKSTLLQGRSRKMMKQVLK